MELHKTPHPPASRRDFLRLAGAGGALMMLAACRPLGFLNRPEPTPEPKELHLLVSAEFNFLLDFQSLRMPWREAYPYWPLTVHEGSFQGIQERVATSLAEGQSAYDGAISVSMPLETVSWLDQDLIQPWDPHIEESSIPDSDRIMADMYGSVREAVSSQGRLMGLPISVSSVALAWLTQPLAEAGVTNPPVTWDDVRFAAEAVKSTSSLTPYDRAFSPLGDLMAMLWSGEDDPYGPDGIEKWNGEVAVRALEWMQEMVWSDLMPPRERGFDQWMSGRTAMMISPDLHGAVAQSQLGVDAAITGQNMRMHFDDPKSGTVFWANTMVLPRGADNTDGAAAFGLWWLGPGNIPIQRRIADIAPKPAYRYVFEDDLMAGARYDWQRDAMEAMANSTPLRPTATFAQEQDVIQTWVERALDWNQGLSARQALDNAHLEVRNLRA